MKAMEYRKFLKKRNITDLFVIMIIGLLYHYRYDIYYYANSYFSRDDEYEYDYYVEEVEADKDEIISICNLRYNKTEQCIYTPKGNLIADSIDWIYIDQSGECIVPFSRNDKRGYVNIKVCTIHIAPKYDHAWVFREGLAAVDLKGSLFFIDMNGKPKIEGYNYIPNKDFYFNNGFSMAGKDSLVGLIDKQGKWIISPTYDYIKQYDQNTIHAILPNHRIIVYNSKGKRLNDCFINQILINEKYPYVYTYESDRGWFGLMNLSGKRISEPLYQSIKVLENNIICIDENNIYDIYNRSGALLFKNINNVSVINRDNVE